MLIKTDTADTVDIRAEILKTDIGKFRRVLESDSHISKKFL